MSDLMTVLVFFVGMILGMAVQAHKYEIAFTFLLGIVIGEAYIILERRCKK